MGIDAAITCDFHGDGHPQDLTDLRLQELDAYHRMGRKQSDSKFLLIPAEEADVILGGHWAVVFPIVIDHTSELYAHMNANYVRIGELPDFDHYGRMLEAVSRGDYFISMGEVLLPEVEISKASPFSYQGQSPGSVAE
jgi:hypothetical protein